MSKKQTKSKSKPEKATSSDSQPTQVEAVAISVCAKHDNRPDELLEIFHDLQHQLGYVPDATLTVIAHALNLSRAEVYGVRTFYHDFHPEPVGQHVIKICRAEACQAMGTFKLCDHAEKKLGTKFGSTSDDGAYTLEAVYCLGNCAMSPAMLIDDELYGRLDSKRFDKIVDGLSKEAAE